MLLGVGSCRRDSGSPQSAPATGNAPTEPTPSVANTVAVTHELLDDVELCEARYRGLVVDLSSRSSDAARSFRVGPFDDVRYESHAGEQVGVVQVPTLEFDIWMERAVPAVEVALRLEAVAARNLTLTIDGVSAGTRALKSGEVNVVRYLAPQSELSRGRHTLGLRFGGKRRGDEPYALTKWLRVYLPSDADANYAAPTRGNLLEDVAVSGEPLRAISLRAPGSLRCGLMPGARVRLKLNVAYRGTGTANAQVRVATADGKSVQLWGQVLEGTEDLRWVPVDVSLDPFVGQVVGIEFAADDGKGMGRVLFAEPRLERQDPAVASPLADQVVLVVAAGLDRATMPPWGDRTGLSNLFALSEQGVTFDGYRATSSIATSVLATLLTTSPPSAHGILSLSGRLPSRIPLFSRLLQERGGSSALFANVPTSDAVFGFDRHWGHFEAHSPLEDMPAAAPLLSGVDWLKKALTQPGPRLLVTHVSGGHPPWDVTHEELATLPPKDYEGPIDPRRGALTLRDYRYRAAAGRKTLTPGDWERITALQSVSLRKLDLGLGSLFRFLRESGQWERSLVVVMGDVGSGDRPEVPFAPDGALTEGRLAAPLIVKFPGGLRPRARVATRVATPSVARTIADALALTVPHTPATALTTLAELGEPLESNPVLARAMGDYAFYLGRYVLRGRLGQVPALYDLEMDPATQLDLASEQPFLVQWLWRLCLREMARAAVGAAEPETAVIDAETRGALAAFGI